MSQIAKLTTALEQFYAQAQQAKKVADAATAQHLQALLDQVQANMGKLTEEHERASAALDQQVAAAKQAADEARQKAAAARAEHAAAQEAAKKPPTPPPPKPLPPIDPQLAQQLRKELLERFGGVRPPETGSGELWQELIDWQKPGSR
jgi:septal ring factor EnvC (AmiA/AmiB activator)